MFYNNLPNQSEAMTPPPSSDGSQQHGLILTKTFWLLFLAGIILFPLGLALSSTSSFWNASKPSFSQVTLLFGGFFFVASLFVLFVDNNVTLRKRWFHKSKTTKIFLLLQTLFLTMDIYWFVVKEPQAPTPFSNLLLAFALCAGFTSTVSNVNSRWKSFVLFGILLAVVVGMLLLVLTLTTSNKLYFTIAGLYAILVMLTSIIGINMLGINEGERDKRH